MKRLTILRHAKSSWKDTSLRDRDRPLNKRGERDAPKMGKRIDAAGIRPSLIVSSPAVRAWTTAKIIADEIGYPIRVLFTRPHDHEIFRVQREAVRNAQKYIYVENAYFTDDAMLYELAHARRRGVDVRVIMPLVTDRGPITRSNALAANAMLEHGVRVYIYPGMSHIKAAVFDGWACIGSANWDRWSFRINKELNIATSHPYAVAELERRVFAADFSNSVEMMEPFPERWTDHLIEVVGDYIF